MPAVSPFSDHQILEMLHQKDHHGMTFAAIATAHGVTRASVAGLMFRINKDTDKHDPDGNQNGTMPPRWWANRKRRT